MKKIFSIALIGLALASHVYAQNLQASHKCLQYSHVENQGHAV